MKKIICVFCFISFTMLLLSQNLWENPVSVRKSNPIISNCSSIRMQNGVVTLWSETRNNYSQLYAQYYSLTGQKLWSQEGLLIDDNNLNHGDFRISKLNETSLIVFWINSIVGDASIEGSNINAQKLDLQGNRLWGNNGIDIMDYSYNFFDNLRIFPDQEGGCYFTMSPYQPLVFTHVDNNGLILPLINCNFDMPAPYDHVLDILYEPDSSFVVSYTCNQKATIAKFSLSGEQIWGPIALSNDQTTSVFNIRKINNNYLCLWNNEYRNIMAQYISESGTLVWSDTSRVVYNGVFILYGMNTVIAENHAFICLNENGQTKLIKIDVSGNTIWDEPVLIDTFVMDVPVIEVRNEALYCFWLGSTRTDFTPDQVKACKLNFDGTSYWQPQNKIIYSLNAYFSNLSALMFDNEFFLIWMDKINCELQAQVLLNNEQLLFPENPLLIKKGLNSLVMNYKIVNNGTHALIVWESRPLFSKCKKPQLYYQIVSAEGEISQIENGTKIFETSCEQKIMDLKTDDYGNFILWWSEFSDTCSYSKIQKIDESGNLLYGTDGLKIFEDMTRYQGSHVMTLLNDEYFFYISSFIYEECFQCIVGQKVINGQIQWENNGKVIVKKALYPFNIQYSSCFLLELDIKENIIAWAEKKVEMGGGSPHLRLLKLNSEGLADNLWNDQGTLVFPTSNIPFKGVKILSLPEEYLCIGYTCTDYYEYKYYYQSVSRNGILNNPLNNLIISGNNIVLKEVYYHNQLKMLFDHTQYSPLDVSQMTFNFSNSTLTPVIDNLVLFHSFFNIENYFIFYDFAQMYDKLLFLNSSYKDVFLSVYNESSLLMGTPYLINHNDYWNNEKNEISMIDNTTMFIAWNEYIFNNDCSIHNNLYIHKFSATSMNDLSDVVIMPTSLQLDQNYPNPFNPITNIAYTLDRDVEIEINIYNIKGQKVKSLLKSMEEKGKHIVSWDSTDDNACKLASGIYFYTLKAGEQRITKKMILLK